jgi:hypothetical protein
MSWNTDQNYSPMTMDQLYSLLCENINFLFGTSYDINSIKATNWYRLAYPTLQLIRQNEIEFAEINTKLQDFIRNQNAEVISPISSYSGLIEYFKINGFNAAINWLQNSDQTAYGVMITVDTDQNASNFETEVKPKILDLIKNSLGAGVPMLGNIGAVDTLIVDYLMAGYLSLSNGQSIPAVFYTTFKIPIHIVLKITLSHSFIGVVDTTDEIKTKLLKNLSTWQIGRPFEPERYFEINTDALYAANIELGYYFISGDIPTKWQSATTILPHGTTSADAVYAIDDFSQAVANVISLQFSANNIEVQFL